MARRRGTTDSLNPVNEPRWLVVRDRVSRPIEFQMLAPGADIRRALKSRAAALAAQGWNVQKIPPNCCFFFCDRESERWCVSIDCYEPGNLRR